jgi:hypothetical protein
MRAFRSLLFSRIVPCVRDIGLWGDRVKQAYRDMNVLDLGRADLVRLMDADEKLADDLDAERLEVAARVAEVGETIRQGRDTQ